MIQEYLNHQRINKGLSESTLQGYAKDLNFFVKWARGCGLRWSTVKHTDMEAYVRAQVTEGYAPRTIKRRTESVRLIYKYMIHEGLIEANPAQYTETPKVPDTLREAAEGDKLRAYLDKPATTREGHIIHFVISLILETGLRIGEVLELRGTDIDTAKRSILVRQGKGKRGRYVFYADRFARYADACCMNPNRIIQESDIAIRYMMYKELGNNHIASPHTIRHCFATEQLDKGMRLKTLSVLMGHKNVSTTEIYARMSRETLAEEYRQLN